MRDFFGLLIAIPVLVADALWHRLTHDPFDDEIAAQHQRLVELWEGN